MKALFITILIFVAAFLIYDRFITPPMRRVFFDTPRFNPYGETDARPRADYSTPVPTKDAPSPMPSPEAGEFVPPHIEPLESLTKNWTVFPPAAFPRQVKISKPVQLQLAGGSSTLPAGSTAYALSAEANVLMVAPTETSDARGQIFVHDTDLPTQVRESYERWKRGRIEIAMNAWKKQRSSPTLTGILMPDAVEPSGAPRRNTDGSYDLLLASMRSGQVTDIKAGKIQRWGTPQQRTIDNQSTWAVSVFYETMAFCGPIDAEAQAHIRNGTVVRWIYPGSGEPVP